MALSPDLITSIIIALFGGGALVKILELFSQRSRLMVEVSRDEKENLRSDIVSLRQEINELREEVSTLREQLNDRSMELSRWARRFFSLKLAIEKIIIYLNSSEHFKDDEKLQSLMSEASRLMSSEDVDYV